MLDDKIYAINNTSETGLTNVFRFGRGFNRILYQKTAYEVDPLNEYITNDFVIDIKKYIYAGFFKLKPVILEYDDEDEDLANIKYEIFENLVKEENKYITTIEKNQRVIYVIEPVYPVKTIQYKEYIKNREKAKINAISIYSETDLSTHRESVFSLISSGALESFIEDHLSDRLDVAIDDIQKFINYIKKVTRDLFLGFNEIKEKEEDTLLWLD